MVDNEKAIHYAKQEQYTLRRETKRANDEIALIDEEIAKLQRQIVSRVETLVRWKLDKAEMVRKEGELHTCVDKLEQYREDWKAKNPYYDEIMTEQRLKIAEYTGVTTFL